MARISFNLAKVLFGNTLNKKTMDEVEKLADKQDQSETYAGTFVLGMVFGFLGALGIFLGNIAAK